MSALLVENKEVRMSDVRQGHNFILRFVKQGRTDRHIEK